MGQWMAKPVGRPKLPPGVLTKHPEKLTRWTDKTGMLSHKRLKVANIVEEEGKKKATDIIKKEFEAVIGRVAIDDIAQIQEQFLETIKKDDRKLTHQQQMLLTNAMLTSQKKILDMIVDKEFTKRRKNMKILKWAAKHQLSMAEVFLAELRKANFELDEMQHGKKRVNVNANVPAQSIESFLEIKKENIIDAEQEPVMDDNTGIDTDKK
jgi:dsRNA-specific ribonuclease